MADAKIIEIAADLLTALNAEREPEDAFSQTFTATRAYRPPYKLEDMEAIHVTVMPGALETGVATRGAEEGEYRVDIAVHRRFEGEPTIEQLDPLVYLMQEIRQFFLAPANRQLTTSGATCLGALNEPAWIEAHLVEWHQFTSVLTLRVVHTEDLAS